MWRSSEATGWYGRPYLAAGFKPRNNQGRRRRGRGGRGAGDRDGSGGRNNNGDRTHKGHGKRDGRGRQRPQYFYPQPQYPQRPPNRSIPQPHQLFHPAIAAGGAAAAWFLSEVPLSFIKSQLYPKLQDATCLVSWNIFAPKCKPGNLDVESTTPS